MSDDLVKSFESAADLSGKQFYCVQPSAGNKLCALGTNSERIIGILQNKPESGEAAAVMIAGISKAKIAANSLSTGDFLTCDTVGKLVQTAAADEFIAAMLLDDSDTVLIDDVRDVLIMHALAHAADTGM